jgi:hypothetical protein
MKGNKKEPARKPNNLRFYGKSLQKVATNLCVSIEQINNIIPEG